MVAAAIPYAIAGAGQVANAIWGGDQADPNDAGDLHLANVGQQELYNMMLQRIRSGAGDFGMGASTKAGKSQLAQFMADRGINPSSGTGVGAYANMLGTAGAQANQNRLGYAMNLLRTPLQVVSSSGANWLPESPSYGYDSAQQWKTSARNRKLWKERTGYRPGTAQTVRA